MRIINVTSDIESQYNIARTNVKTNKNELSCKKNTCTKGKKEKKTQEKKVL